MGMSCLFAEFDEFFEASAAQNLVENRMIEFGIDFPDSYDSIVNLINVIRHDQSQEFFEVFFIELHGNVFLYLILNINGSFRVLEIAEVMLFFGAARE